MLNKLQQAIANDNELDSKTLRILSLVFLAISGAMSFFKYTSSGGWYSFFSEITITFQPGFISTILAIFIITPLYLRGILKWNKSIYSIVSFILILLVFASFTELALGGNDNIATRSLIAISIILSWLGISAIAGISWILALVAAIYSIIINNIAMGFFGFIYIGLGFLGLVLHSGLNPGEFFSRFKIEYSQASKNSTSSIKNNISANKDYRE